LKGTPLPGSGYAGRRGRFWAEAARQSPLSPVRKGGRLGERGRGSEGPTARTWQRVENPWASAQNASLPAFLPDAQDLPDPDCRRAAGALITPTLFSQPPSRPPGEEGEVCLRVLVPPALADRPACFRARLHALNGGRETFRGRPGTFGEHSGALHGWRGGHREGLGRKTGRHWTHRGRSEALAARLGRARGGPRRLADDLPREGDCPLRSGSRPGDWGKRFAIWGNRCFS
jgi:hypothetical protein